MACLDSTEHDCQLHCDDGFQGCPSSLFDADDVLGAPPAASGVDLTPAAIDLRRDGIIDGGATAGVMAFERDPGGASIDGCPRVSNGWSATESPILRKRWCSRFCAPTARFGSGRGAGLQFEDGRTPEVLPERHRMSSDAQEIFGMAMQIGIMVFSDSIPDGRPSPPGWLPGQLFGQRMAFHGGCGWEKGRPATDGCIEIFARRHVPLMVQVRDPTRQF